MPPLLPNQNYVKGYVKGLDIKSPPSLPPYEKTDSQKGEWAF